MTFKELRSSTGILAFLMQVLFMVTKRKNKSLSGRILFIIIMKDLFFYCYKLNYSINIDLAVGTEIIVNSADTPSFKSLSKRLYPSPRNFSNYECTCQQQTKDSFHRKDSKNVLLLDLKVQLNKHIATWLRTKSGPQRSECWGANTLPKS